MIMKIKELKSSLQKENIDIALFYNLNTGTAEPNFFYFTGYEGYGALAIPKTGSPFLLAPKMEFEKSKNSMIRRVYVWDKKRLFESISSILKRKKSKSGVIGIDYSSFTVEVLNGLKKSFRDSRIKDISRQCKNLRVVKTADEIELIRKGCIIADRIFMKAVREFERFTTESDVASFLEYQAKKQGLEVSFKPIVASGSGSSMPHYMPAKIPLRKGFCVIDFGVKYRGYCTDMTRTLYLGKPKSSEVDIYNMLLNIQKSAINSAIAGELCGNIYALVIKQLGKYSKYFIHGLGHGVGVEIHELPNLKLESSDKLKDNMVFTIEPGIYFSGKFGIRIEDTLAILNGKTEVLTKSPKELMLKKQNSG